MQDNHSRLQNTIRPLPLTDSQLGVWMVEQLSDENAFSIAQYTEIQGELSVELLLKAIRQGLSQADTLHSRYEPMGKTVVQWIPPSTASKDIEAVRFFDLSRQETPLNCAQALMAKDLQSPIKPNGENTLYQHILFKLDDSPRWLWYQRYHHLMVDAFSIDALTRRIVSIYQSLLQGQSVSPSPFTPFEKVVEEYQAYQHTKQYAKDRHFWLHYAMRQPQPLTLSTMSAVDVKPFSAKALKYELTIDLTGHPLSEDSKALTDIMVAVVLIYLSRMTGNDKVTIGYPFIRRFGSVALTATGPTVNILPMRLEVTPRATLSDVVAALIKERGQLRQHQKYDAVQIQRDLGLVGSNKRLFGPTVTFSECDSQCNLWQTTGTTHRLTTGPVEDIEFGIHPNQDSVTIALLGHPQKYTLDELEQHGKRLEQVFEQLLVKPSVAVAQLSLPNALKPRPTEPSPLAIDTKANDLKRPPKTKLEFLLCIAMSEVLNTTVINMNDDFFELGGDSIKALLLCTKMRHNNYQLSPRDIFEKRTVKGVVSALKQNEVLDPLTAEIL